MNLLASINCKVADVSDAVSPYCHVSFVNASENDSPQSRTFTQAGESVPFEIPHLIFGVDLTDMMRLFHEQSQAFFRGEAADLNLEMDKDEINRNLRRRP